jgi:hypothetical protein
MLAAAEGAAGVKHAVFCLLAAVLTCAAAGARTLQLTFRDGRVTLTAGGGTTAAEVLAEWSRIGGTRIVNAERLDSSPLTLELKDVPELEALEIILRSTGGFIATARPAEPASTTPQPSSVAQITVMPASRQPAPLQPMAADAPPPPEAPAPVAPPIVDASGARRVIGPDGQPIPDDQDDQAPAGR